MDVFATSPISGAAARVAELDGDSSAEEASDGGGVGRAESLRKDSSRSTNGEYGEESSDRDGFIAHDTDGGGAEMSHLRMAMDAAGLARIPVDRGDRGDGVPEEDPETTGSSDRGSAEVTGNSSERSTDSGGLLSSSFIIDDDNRESRDHGGHLAMAEVMATTPPPGCGNEALKWVRPATASRTRRQRPDNASRGSRVTWVG